MISILFEKSQFPSEGEKENLNLSQGEGITGRERWYCGYVDTPDKRIGQYRVIMVLQSSILKTGILFIHELIHIGLNLIYGEEEVGNKIHLKFDGLWLKVKKIIYKMF